MIETKPLILVTNDDGITAPGIRALIEVASETGEVWVVAPDSPQSGMGHAITINKILSLQNIKAKNGAAMEFSCSGTPVDCVKLAKDKILPRKPALCVSGINHGANSSINVIYSGTMSAAIEAGVENIPAIGFSLLDDSWEANFNPAKPFIRKIILKALENDMQGGTVLNVNIPKGNNLRGIKLCRQAMAKWEEEYEERINPYGQKYYWLTGKFVDIDRGEDTDIYALNQGYISAVPVSFDLTGYKDMDVIKKWDLGS